MYRVMIGLPSAAFRHKRHQQLSVALKAFVSVIDLTGYLLCYFTFTNVNRP